MMDRNAHSAAIDPFDAASVIASTTASGVAAGSGGASGPLSSTASVSGSAVVGSPGRTPRQKRSTREGQPSKPRAVAWSDRGRKKSNEQEKYTFFRDPTPPPIDRVAVSAPIVPNEPYDYKYDHVAPPAPIPVAMVCGVRRRTFIMVMTAVVLIIIIAVGVGVGVGVGMDQDSSSSSSDPQSSTPDAESSGIPPPTTTSEPTSSQALPNSPSVTMSSNPAITTLVSCPAANDTIYKVPSSRKVFLRVCGIDFTGRGNVVELAHTWTPTMEDCMINCAGYPGCEACSWGVIEDDPGSYHRCWFKQNITRSNEVRDGWDFAILQEEEED